MDPLPRPDQVASAAGNLAHRLLYGGVADLGPMPRALIDDGLPREVNRYRPQGRVQDSGDPVLLVTPLAAPAPCFDLRRGCSMVEHLVGQGRRTYLVEYGEVSFANRTLGLEHWVDEVVPTAVRAVSEHADGRPVHVVGWSFGGVFARLAAADGARLPIASLTVLGSPVDVTRVPLVAPIRPLLSRSDGGGLVTQLYRALGGAPKPLVRRAFQLSSFHRLVTTPLAVAARLDDRDFLAQVEAVARHRRVPRRARLPRSRAASDAGRHEPSTAVHLGLPLPSCRFVSGVVTRPLAGLLATLVLGACGSGSGGPGTVDPAEEVRRPAQGLLDAAPAGFDRYVALGDSFTAAPLVPDTDLADGCFRSDGNYPALVAERLAVEELVDVSCSGAATRDLEARQRTVRDATVPPQLRALSPDADLVTLGIGGNDLGVFHTLVTCSRLRHRDPAGSPCATSLAGRGVDLVARARAVGPRVERALGLVRRRAPGATVVLVGYPRLVPDEGHCRDLPFAAGDYDFAVRVSRTLNAALARAARRTDVGFVDLHRASAGHDICAEQAWVNGRRTVRGVALAYHPVADGMEAAADEVVDLLTR